MAFSYPHKAIYSLAGVSKALQVPLPTLVALAAKSDGMYRLAKPVIKADGSTRQPFDALEPLKGVQKRIQSAFLTRVNFPDYLTGSLKGKDPTKNAEIHVGANTVVCEDIEQFFPSTSAALIESIWTGFFGFGDDVAELLTALTTKDGALPQGAVTSSYLANLAFWNKEPALHTSLASRGIRYSRYVDDVTMSSKVELAKADLTWCIAQVYGMMKSCGYSAKRKKHEITRSNGPMFTTKLMVNAKPALPTSTRQNIRAEVHRIMKSKKELGTAPAKSVNSARGKLGRLKRLHPTEGQTLKRKLTAALSE